MRSESSLDVSEHPRPKMYETADGAGLCRSCEPFAEERAGRDYTAKCSRERPSSARRVFDICLDNLQNTIEMMILNDRIGHCFLAETQ
ncbi:hypothetical protein EVAR_102719_1 [Eumeta japonica]|uniref:Uncharacterized protein n=1 Tax=Eumeta variegata TaxID=151549 RepID=A0A4C1TIT6_EUMVA|nr:hypothetical protein EVAR_102719_1 [Eumeta japonica]